MRKLTLTAAALSATLPALALAWTPYGPGAFMPPPYQGYAGPHGFPIQPPAYPAAPGGYPGEWSAAGQPMAAMPKAATAVPPAWPSLNLSRQVTEDAYLVDIQLENIDPAQVEVRPTKRGLVIRHHAETQVSQQDSLPGGAGYRSRYSLSRGSASRRVGLPPDADLAGMSREVKEGHILIRVPRNAQARGGRW